MIKLIKEELWTDEFNGHTIKSCGYKGIDRICLLVDDEPYLIADMNGTLRVFVDWVDRVDVFMKKKIIGGKRNEDWFVPFEIYLETTEDECELIRLLRKLTKYPNGRVTS